MIGRSLRAGVVGGGIGGLAAAHALLRRGLDVTVFERAPALGEVGAGLMVYPNSLRLLERLGLGDALDRVGARLGPRSAYYRRDGTLVGPVTITDSAGWNGMYGMHRADLLQTLADHLPAGIVRTGHHCTGFEQDEGEARLSFANGATFAADVVIAADGLQSALQHFVVEPSKPVYSGSRAYRGLLARSALPDWPGDAHEVWMGDGKHFMVFPVRSGELLNYVGFVPTEDQTVEEWSAIGDRDQLAASFAGWDPRVEALLDKVERCYWWGLYDRLPLRRWTRGRLALLGDAAHPMLPHLGQGANQAIEDGFALALALESRPSQEVATALETYEQVRRRRTDVVQAEARRNGLRYDTQCESVADRDTEIRNSSTLRKWLYDFDAESMAEEAVS